MSLFKFVVLTIFFIAFKNSATAQDDFAYFSPTSKQYYSSKIEELKTRKPSLKYTDKDQQKYYESILKSRDEGLKTDLENNLIIHDTFLLNKCTRVLDKIKKANAGFDYKPVQFFIYRSAVPNAASLGDGSFYVNLGLFLIVDNEEELAFILGHELAHFFLAHFEKRIDNNISLLGSEEFKEEMKSIKKSQDGRYLRFRKLMKDVTTKGGAHSRFKESDADSLAVTLVSKAGYRVDKSARILLKLDHSDDFFSKDKLFDIKSLLYNKVPEQYFAPRKRKYNGLSSVEVTMNADADFDSISTHPDCAVRYFAVTKMSDTTDVGCCANISKAEFETKRRTLVELTRRLYELERYTNLVQLSLFARNSGYNEGIFHDYISLSFSGIAKAERKIRRFSVTNAMARPNTTLKELQEIIFRMEKDDLLVLSDAALIENEKGMEEHDFAMMKYRVELTPENETTLTASFLNKYPQSKFAYLLLPPAK